MLPTAIRALLLIVTMLLAGCGNTILGKFEEAKDGGASHTVCFEVAPPSPLRGKYCLQYVGDN